MPHLKRRSSEAYHVHVRVRCTITHKVVFVRIAVATRRQFGYKRRILTITHKYRFSNGIRATSISACSLAFSPSIDACARTLSQSFHRPCTSTSEDSLPASAQERSLSTLSASLLISSSERDPTQTPFASVRANRADRRSERLELISSARCSKLQERSMARKAPA